MKALDGFNYLSINFNYVSGNSGTSLELTNFNTDQSIFDFVDEQF